MEERAILAPEDPQPGAELDERADSQPHRNSRAPWQGRLDGHPGLVALFKKK
jgi:hypothetical protein